LGNRTDGQRTQVAGLRSPPTSDITLPCISAASRSARPLPRGFSGHVAHPSRSILQRLTNRFRIDALLVAFQKEFCVNRSVGSDDERARVGNPFDTFRRFPIKDPVSIDGFAAGIRKQRVGDGVFRGEPAENGHGIVADRHHLTAGRFQFLQVGLQLDQLLLAEGSPIRRTEKDQRDGPFLDQGLERDVMVRLIFQGKRRRFFADGQSGVFGSRRFRRARCLCQKKPKKGDRDSDQFHVREDSPAGEARKVTSESEVRAALDIGRHL
jgi:hypothetical protein